MPWLILNLLSSYDLLNYQYSVDELGREHYGYVQVGRWKSGGFVDLGYSKIQWPLIQQEGGSKTPWNDSSIVESICSRPCGFGEAKVSCNLFFI